MKSNILCALLPGLIALASCDHPAGPRTPSGQIRFSPAQSLDVDLEDSSLIAAHVELLDGSRVAGRQITWTIDDPAIAAIAIVDDTMASIRGLKLGTTKLIAHSEDLAASLTINVKTPVAGLVTVNPSYFTLEPGTERQLTATVLSKRSNPIRQPKIVWSSSDIAVATVDPMGKVRAVGAGAVEISATVDGIAGKSNLYVATPFVSVTAGYQHNCALKPEGRVYCWGSNAFGQLGGDTPGSTNIPTPIATEQRFASVHSLSSSTCALTTDGALYCWGVNEGLGFGASPPIIYVPTLVPTSVRFAQVSAGARHICALDSKGQTYCWGYGFAAGTNSPTGEGLITVPTLLADAPPFVQIASGGNFSCGLTADGKAYCWGSDNLGQLGDSVPGKTNFDGSIVPAPVAGGHTFSRLQIGNWGDHACAIGTDGKSYCWGNYIESYAAASTVDCLRAQHSPSGFSQYRCTPFPIPVTGGETFSTIVTQNYQRCGLNNGGVLYCWGTYNLTLFVQQLYPQPVLIPTELRFTTLSGSNGSYCGITTSKALYCWKASLSPSMELVFTP